MVNFCNRLRDLRKAKCLTQSQVAEIVGGSKAMISSYELGTRYPPYDVLVKLARLYGVSTDFLLGVKNNYSLDAQGLTPEQFSLLYSLINEFKRK